MTESGNDLAVELTPRGRKAARWTSAFFMGLLVTLALVAGSSSSKPPENPVKSATVFQKGRQLVFRITIRPEVVIKDMQRMPDVSKPSTRYLCAEFSSSPARATKRLCVGGKNRTYESIGLTLVGDSGKTISDRAVSARVERVSDHIVEVGLLPGRAGITPDRYRWRAIYSDPECGRTPDECSGQFPVGEWADYRVRPVDPVGCTGGNGQVVRRGPGGAKEVALTFDDGPSPYTRQVLSILREKKAKGTFFVIGSAVASDPSTTRKIVADGHEIANHSYTHPILPSGSELRRTNQVIRDATRFKPCLFRPPYGAIDGRLAAEAGAQKMKSILWDIDTNDWRTPGSGSIYSSIVSAGSGSIVLMHDGGGYRSQTVAALGPAISNLKRRGYRLVTVSKLLGNRTIYRPR
jgi:peptidoglycan/xylan/chitin deacetylase (PgdA/CDA1 family)